MLKRAILRHFVVLTIFFVGVVAGYFSIINHDGRDLVDLNVLQVDRAKPFDPRSFIGQGWTIWKGSINGNGLSGEEEQDRVSLELSKIPLKDILAVSSLKSGESYITGEEALRRLHSGKNICLDANVAKGLYEEEGQTSLRWLYTHRGIEWVEFPGTTLRYANGNRYSLYLYRSDDGSWRWDYYYLGIDRDVSYPAAVLSK